ncbi:hexose transporter [Gymnopus androsaceus JB14]|uniref:Hexose transporter n=1 Tax=Gymnopus androsaceus JB14 TaxID=1447944 RepID=A0A6A4HBQ5_9AGAR|nr:hexose transporter [Gymnopus androsaceus JB14]
MAVGAATSAHVDSAIESLQDPKKTWYNNRRLIALNGWIVLLLITSSTNGYDGSMMNGLQSLPQWQSYFKNPDSSELGLLNAIQNIGALAAYPFAPYLSDGIGRRPTVFIGALIMTLATAVQGASQSAGMFIGARFLIGFGLTFAANAAPMLVSEISYPKYRAPLTATYNSLWYSGAIVAAWTTFGTFKIKSTWSWRIPSILQGLPAIAQLLLIWFVPESPRFLISKGKDEKAMEVLAYYHADSNANHPLVRYEFNEIKAAIEYDRTVTANVGYKAFISSPGNLKRLRIIVAIAFFSQWSGNGLVSYYLNKILSDIGITDPTTQLLINGILSIWNLICALIASSLVEKLGRRLMFLTSAVGMLVFFTAQTIAFAQFQMHQQPAAAHAVIAFIFLFYAFYDLAFTPLIVAYTIEILPYPMRAKGFNIFNFTISLALIFNQYVNPIALVHITWKYYVVYCVWLLIECIFLYKYVVETKNLTLEETAAIFDGEEAEKEILAAAAERDLSEKPSVEELDNADLKA